MARLIIQLYYTMSEHIPKEIMDIIFDYSGDKTKLAIKQTCDEYNKSYMLLTITPSFNVYHFEQLSPEYQVKQKDNKLRIFSIVSDHLSYDYKTDKKHICLTNRYHGKTPLQAANKIFTILCRSSSNDDITFCMYENNKYYYYHCCRQKLSNPSKVCLPNGPTIMYEFCNNVKSVDPDQYFKTRSYDISHDSHILKFAIKN